MITDKDITKLKKTFVTKNYLHKEFDKHTKMIVGELKIIIEMIGKALEKDKEQDDILDDHERQLDRLNGKVFSQS